MPEILTAILSHENAHFNDAGDELLIDVCVTCRSTVKAHYCTDLKSGQRLLWTKTQGLNSSLWNVLKESARVGKIVREARDKANQVPDPCPLLPADLKALERFGLYRLVWNDKTKKNDKPPYNARTHIKGNPKDKSERSTYDIVSKVLATDTRYQGAGFGMQYSDGYTCTDFDHCVDAAGVIEPRVKKILDETNSYAEFSPSGDGIHLWTKGWQVPIVDGKEGRKVGNAEMYSGKHYMTVTGKHVSTTPLTVELHDMSALYQRICSGEFNPVPTTTAAQASTSLSENTLHGGRLQHHQGPITTELALLMTGQFTENATPFTVSDEGECNTMTFHSQSEAIASLCFHLAAKHRGDADKIEAEFVESTLYQGISKWNTPNGKWDRLGGNEIKNAIARYEQSAVARDAATPVMCGESGEDSNYNDEDEAQEPLPDFPKMTGSLADLCHAICPDIPFEFKFMVALAFFGLFRSGIDVLAIEPHLQTRFYVSLIAHAWRGKTAALKEIRKIMTALYTVKDFMRTASVDSGPALIEQFWGLQKRQGLQLENGANPRRVAIMVDPDEMSDLFEKGKVTANSKNSTFGEFLKLYDGNETENTTKKDGRRFIPNAHLAFVAGATIKGYPMLWSCTGASASGLMSRWTPIGTNAGRVPIEQRQTDGEKLTNAAMRVTAQLQHPGRKLRLTPDAARMLREWSDAAPTGEDAQTAQARVSDMVKKLLIVLAATNDTDEIGTDMVSLGIQFGDYVITLRERYNPQDSWTWAQAFENEIIAALKKKGNLSNRDLMRTIHPARKPGGYGSFRAGLKNLTDVKRVISVPESGLNHKKVWHLSGG